AHHAFRLAPASRVREVEEMRILVAWRELDRALRELAPALVGGELVVLRLPDVADQVVDAGEARHGLHAALAGDAIAMARSSAATRRGRITPARRGRRAARRRDRRRSCPTPTPRRRW